MGETTAIGWTNSTWNPWYGCRKVSPGCKNCYMFRDMKRFGKDPTTVHLASRTTFRSPLRWKEPRMVFACSWSDWFIEDADEWRPLAWDIIRQTPHHTYQILTKRPERIAELLPPVWPLDNVWLGVSIESQSYIGRWWELVKTPAKIRFVSAEPLLGRINLDMVHVDPDWVITGGESGPGWRSAEQDWFREIRDWCQEHGVPFFHKQNGGTRKMIDRMDHGDSAWGGRELDGRVYDEMPTAATLEMA